MKTILVIFTIIQLSNSNIVPKIETPEKTFTFWQISDIHYDKYYSENGEVLDFCHNNMGNGIAGRFGDYQCESTKELLESALQAMKRINPNPDFILSTGDSGPHWSFPDFPNLTYIYEAETFISKKILEYFPNTTIIPVMGNHDAYKPDNFSYNDPATYKNTSAYRTQQYLEFLENSGWKSFITEEKAQKDFGFCGFYKKYLPNLNLVIIALNTNLYYRTNIKYLNPCDQFFWLDSQLEEAKHKKRKVLITGHIPPGFYERDYIGPFFDQIREDQPKYQGDSNNQMYADLAESLHEVIVAHIFGHTHTDSFRIMTDIHRNPIGSLLLAPSVTPRVTRDVGTNPGIRQYHYTNNSDYLLDYDQYFMNLEKANLLYQIEWEKLYSFRSEYNVTDLSAQNLRSVLNNIKENSDVFDTAYSLNTLLHYNGPCDYYCSLNFVCAMGNTKEIEMHHCLETGGGDFPIKRKIDWTAILMYILAILICAAFLITCCYKFGCFEDCCWIRRLTYDQIDNLAEVYGT